MSATRSMGASSKPKRVKVSVTMPAYNAAPYIERAIESVLGQNYDSFELLIGDDASRDDTASILKAYRRHPRVRVFRGRKNRGSPAMRNRLIAMASGAYISVCDADDELAPGNIALLAPILDKNPSIGVAHGEIQ